MLLLERKIDEELELRVDDETLKIKVCRVRGKRVLLGFEGNDRIRIQRKETNKSDPNLGHLQGEPSHASVECNGAGHL